MNHPASGALERPPQWGENGDDDIAVDAIVQKHLLERCFEIQLIFEQFPIAPDVFIFQISLIGRGEELEIGEKITDHPLDCLLVGWVILPEKVCEPDRLLDLSDIKKPPRG